MRLPDTQRPPQVPATPHPPPSWAAPNTLPHGHTRGSRPSCICQRDFSRRDAPWPTETPSHVIERARGSGRRWQRGGATSSMPTMPWRAALGDSEGRVCTLHPAGRLGGAGVQSASRRETRRGVSAVCILEGDSEGQVCSLEGAEGKLRGAGLQPGEEWKGDLEGWVCSLEGAEGRLGGIGLRPGGRGRETRRDRSAAWRERKGDLGEGSAAWREAEGSSSWGGGWARADHPGEERC